VFVQGTGEGHLGGSC